MLQATTFFSEGDDFFHGLREAVAGAKTRIDIELYYLASDAVGWSFADLFMKKAKEGIRIRIIYDAIGCRGTSEEIFDVLRDAGVRIKPYNPLFPLSDPLGRRNHRKCFVIDDRIVFLGGFNLAAEYSAQCLGAKAWRDSGVRFESSEIALTLRSTIDATWDDSRFSWKDFRRRRVLRTVWRSSNLYVLLNHGWRQKSLIREEYLSAISRARRRIWITNGYFIPDRGILGALRRAARRGVDVRIVTAGESDVPAARWASRATYGRLLKAGAKIYEFKGRVLHAKTALIDADWFTVGTSNIDHLSFFRNLEINLFGLDASAADILSQEFLKDVTASEEITWELWRQRPWWQRLRERIFFLFRVWL
jgi:cardiolipin synthase